MKDFTSISDVFADRNRNVRLMDIDIDEVHAVDPGAASILRNTTDILKTVLDRRAELDAQGLHDTPLVIPMGENHNTPAHILRNILFIRGLAEHGQDFSVGMERPHDLLTHLIQNQGDIKVGPSGQKIIDHVDQNGKIGLKADFKSFLQSNAPYTRKVLRQSMIEGDVKSKFVDASFKAYGTDVDATTRRALLLDDTHLTDDALDLSDPTTLQAAKTMTGEVGADDNIQATGPAGMNIRNQHMIDAMPISPISVLLVGNNHVMGFTPDEDDLESMSAEDATIDTERNGIATLAKNAGHAVIAVTIDDKNNDLDHGLDLDTEVITHYKMPTHETGDDLHKIWVHENLYESNEVSWTNTRLENMGLSSIIPDQPLKLTAQYRADLDALVNVINTVQSHPMHQTDNNDHTLDH